MARRKNTKRIDPRYFLEETTNRDLIAEELSTSDAQALALGHTRLAPDRGPRGTDFDPLLDVVVDPDTGRLVRGRYSEADPDVLIRPGAGNVYGPGGVRFSYEGDFGTEDTEIVPEDPGDWPEDMSKFLPIETEPLGPSPGLPYDPYDPGGGKLREAPQPQRPRRSKADPDVLIRPGPNIPSPVTGEPMPGTGGSRFSYEGEFAEPEHIPYDEPSEPVSWAREVDEEDETTMPPDFQAAWDDWKKEDEKAPEVPLDTYRKMKVPDEVPEKVVGEPRMEYLGDGQGVGWVDDSYEGGGWGSPGVLDRDVLPGEGNMAWSPDGRSEFGHGDRFDWAWDEEGDVDSLFTLGSTRPTERRTWSGPIADRAVPYDLVRQHARADGLRIATEDDAHKYWTKNWRGIAPMMATHTGERRSIAQKLDPNNDWYNPVDILRSLYDRAGKGSTGERPEEGSSHPRAGGGIPRDPPGRLEWKPYERGQLVK